MTVQLNKTLLTLTMCNLHLSKYHLLTYLLPPRSKMLLEKLTGSSPSQEIPVFYGT